LAGFGFSGKISPVHLREVAQNRSHLLVGKSARLHRLLLLQESSFQKLSVWKNRAGHSGIIAAPIVLHDRWRGSSA